jgi:3-oxo-5-alpha-steroid 4-dehydrogenase 3
MLYLRHKTKTETNFRSDVITGDVAWENLVEFSRPSWKTTIAFPMFVVASAAQHECHVHLANLKKYTLPPHRLFQSVVCPHYTSECIVYIAISIIAAPPGQIFNSTVLFGLAFVVTNLGVTADSTRKWYIEKFGADKLVGRKRMVPYIY